MTEQITFTSDEKKYLNELSDRCKNLSIFYRKKSKIFKILSYSISISLILANAGTLVLNILGGNHSDNVIKIPTITILGIDTVVSSLKTYLKITEKIQYYIQMAISYEILIEKIESSIASRRPKFNFSDLTKERFNMLKTEAKNESIMNNEYFPEVQSKNNCLEEEAPMSPECLVEAPRSPECLVEAPRSPKKRMYNERFEENDQSPENDNFLEPVQHKIKYIVSENNGLSSGNPDDIMIDVLNEDKIKEIKEIKNNNVILNGEKTNAYYDILADFHTINNFKFI
jgi:hypothetical protein